MQRGGSPNEILVHARPTRTPIKTTSPPRHSALEELDRTREPTSPARFYPCFQVLGSSMPPQE